MKFKENAIKPGMVIHCPKREDEEKLKEYLFDCLGCDNIIYSNRCHESWFHLGKHGCYSIDGVGNIKCMTINECLENNIKITEFSDLIEPDLVNEPENELANEMSAVEVLEWLFKHYRDGIYRDVFSEDYSFEELAHEYEDNLGEIIDKITAYEATKKAPKPVEVEEGYWCRVYTEDDTIIEYIAHDVDEQTAKDGAIDRAMKETAESGERVFADVKYVCWVKEDK